MSSNTGGGLWDALTAARHSTLHCWVDDHWETATWAEVVADAARMTAGLRRHGVRPGARVASVLTNGPAAVRGLLGVWLAGGTIASLPVPARGMDPGEYVQQLETICAALRPEVFLVEQRMLGLLDEDVRARLRVRSWESLADTGTVDQSPPGDDEPAFVQFSSGSTSAPKGCVLTPRAIAAQLGMIGTMLAGRPEGEVAVTWLPLSHDMGVFGTLLTPWVNDWRLHLSTPERFAMAPRTWFGDLAEFGGTMTAGTSTALRLGSRIGRSTRLAGGLDLRACIIGAERVEAETLRGAVDTFGPYGFRAESLMPAYGLAEATLAVAATPVDEPPRHLTVDAVALADGVLSEVDPGAESATAVVGAGVPCAGVELSGAPADRLGEVLVRSPALASGYLDDPERTAERFVDGWLRTGDLGFVRDGHLYPVGRADDVISVAGRKVYAREIENAVDGLAGVRRGCTTLIGAADGRELTMVLEVRKQLDDYRPLAEAVASVAMAKAAVAVDDCVFVARNTLPKTPSGKIQRHRCRQLLATGRLTPLATVHL
ncbi:AMP-binding protein [Actinophytocola gossypii]|uniref:AMP-binding protein n=1 Tax=Actinophytocola gossypii TaxID=2812003 RepID=A0ABT2J8Q7_9PSEU|nr:AMP-binding protein [Actinophytocola gossypii]MCT2583659.1 AMP-binding protein [Actinophytocola gossypii]